MRIAVLIRKLSTAGALTLLAATAAHAAPLDFKDVMAVASTRDFLKIDDLQVVVSRPPFDACVDWNLALCIEEVWHESWVVCHQPWGQEKLVALSCGALRTVTKRCADRTWHEDVDYATGGRYCVESPEHQYLCDNGPGIVQSQDVRISSRPCA
ncbi:MAG TPA: hypothetical protein VEL74_18050 [Thermoanaerobaculia bacterium]|nr:hypothetical protein [Thermoanaerobaculia bacterium]